jgi:hypothetical protein
MKMLCSSISESFFLLVFSGSGRQIKAVAENTFRNFLITLDFVVAAPVGRNVYSWRAKRRASHGGAVSANSNVAPHGDGRIAWADGWKHFAPPMTEIPQTTKSGGTRKS